MYYVVTLSKEPQSCFPHSPSRQVALQINPNKKNSKQRNAKKSKNKNNKGTVNKYISSGLMDFDCYVQVTMILTHPHLFLMNNIKAAVS